MRSVGRILTSALVLASAVACNALLDNPERHLASSAGTGGTGGGAQAGMGGSTNGMGGNAAGAGGRGAGSGGTDTAGDAAVGGASARGGGGNVGGSNGGASGGSTGGSTVAGESGTGDGSGGSSPRGGTGGTGGMVGEAGTGGGSPIVDEKGVPLAGPGDLKTGSGEFLNLGDMRLVNDRTGSISLGCEATTSVYTNTDGSVGWSYDRPDCTGSNTDPDFLGLEFGIHPFGDGSARTASPHYSSTTLMPIQVKDITSASVTVDGFDITLQAADPTYTFGVRLWISLQDPRTSAAPAPSLELVVLWGWSTNRWVCSQSSLVVSGGRDYELCHPVDDYGWQGLTWKYREFWMDGGPVTSFTGTLDLAKFVEWVINTEGYSSNVWVTRFELGTEIYDNTSGTAELKAATFEVNGQSGSIQLAQ